MTPAFRTSPSPTAVGLGYLALVPFVAGAVLACTTGPGLRPAIDAALTAYAAVVVSFIGAIHWGVGFAQASPAPRLFAWGVIPSLVACAASLASRPIGLAILAAMLVVCYLVDRVVYPIEDVATWLPLRLRLTVVAAACCAIAAAGG